MNQPEPRLNKLPFILTDLGCLAAAALIGYFVKDPFAPWPLVVIVVLVLGGGIALLLPFLADYAADCRETTARLSHELEQQIQRVQAASESLSRAASQIKAIEEAVHKSARDAETLPYRMQEKLAEFNEALAEKENDDRAALELELEELRSVNSGNLKTVADKIHKATTDWTTLENSTRKQLTLAQEAASKIDGLLKNSLAQIELRALAASPQNYSAPDSVAEDTPAAVEETKPTPAVVPAAAPTLVEAPTPLLTDDVTVAPFLSTPPTASEAPKAKKPRPPRKPKPEDTLKAMSETPVAASPEVVAPIEAAPIESVQSENGEAANESADQIESSTSSDGATRLLATAYIGIGNKLFIRGDGPGLSWDKGAPMQFVSIGKWGWSTQDAVGPVRVKLLKNDETAALTGDLTLEPGRHTEITALF